MTAHLLCAESVHHNECRLVKIVKKNVYGSIESLVLKPKEEMPVEHLLVLNIKKWLDSERPALQADKEYEEKYSSMLTDPDAEDSTNLGEVPHEEEKGSIPRYGPRRYVGGWW